MPTPPLQLGAFFFGGVEMDDAGAGPPAPMDRRCTNEQMWKATTDYVSSALEAERLGYDSFWTTEHHFQHEGYEVVPERHPAVDLDRRPHAAAAPRDDVQRRAAVEPAAPRRGLLDAAQPVGRAGILGVGRGTVPREVLHLNDKGVSIGSHDNPDQAADDDRNRRVFEESMEIVRMALAEESFSYHGEFFDLPVPGIPDRGSTVQTLSLVPRPLYPYEIWQAVTSPPTLQYVPVVGHGAVFWNQHHAFIKRFWDTYGERYAATHDGHELAAARAADARARRAHRGHPREGDRDGDPGPRRVLEVPRPLRLEPRLHGRGRQAGASRA